jgi:hypothetical protein
MGWQAARQVEDSSHQSQFANFVDKLFRTPYFLADTLPPYNESIARAARHSIAYVNKRPSERVD